MSEYEQCCGSRRHAAQAEPSHDFPVDCAVEPVDSGPTDLCDAGVEQVCSNRCRRMDAEKKHEQRSHEGSAANACETDEHSDDQARQGVQRIDHLDEAGHRSLFVSPVKQ